jgi:hypothetical protein
MLQASRVNMDEQIINQEQHEETPQTLRQAQGRTPLWRKIAWIIVIIILIVAAVQVVLAQKYKATVLVIEGEKKVGVNPTTEVLDFGDLSHDTSATRTVTLKSGGGNGAYIWIMKFGTLSDLIKISDSKIYLKPGEERKVEFSVYMPVSAKTGQRMNAYVWMFKIPKIW